MFCSNCGYQATPGTRYCNRCGGNLLTTNHLEEGSKPVANIGWAAFFLAAATVAIVLGGFGIITEFVKELMIPKPFAPMQTDFRHILPVAIPMIVLGSGTILATVFFMMRIFSRLMNLPQESKPSKKNLQLSTEYRQPPQIPSAPHQMSSVTEHTTRNFDPVPERDRQIHQ